jgi:hypothetical protein
MPPIICAQGVLCAAIVYVHMLQDLGVQIRMAVGEPTENGYAKGPLRPLKRRKSRSMNTLTFEKHTDTSSASWMRSISTDAFTRRWDI